MWFGLIICYKSSTWAFANTGGKSHKICEFGGEGVVSWTPFGTAFWSIFGTILAPFWDNAGAKIAKKGGPKID